MDMTQLGKKAEGKIKEWLDMPDKGYCFDRIPDQMTGFYGSSNICDFTLFKSPSYYYIESKATYEDAFPFSMISDYQYQHLLEKAQLDHVNSYIIVLFASYQRAFILDIRDIDAQIKSGGKKSLNIKKIETWTIPFIEIRTLPSRKALLDYDPANADEIF